MDKTTYKTIDTTIDKTMGNIKTTDPVYTISQLAAACGTSRSGILRLQEDGLLFPSGYDSSGTKRMYSFLDMMKLRQIMMLHQYGFTHATIKDYFEDNGNYTNLISLLAAKQADIFYFLQEMELRMAGGEGLEIEYVYAPAVPCHRVRRIHTFPYYDRHQGMFSEQMRDVIAKKYELSPTRPLFLTTPWDDLAAGADFDGAREFIGHIPLAAMPSEPDPSVVMIPRQRVLSILVRGPHLPMAKIIAMLRDELNLQRLEATGPLYLITIVGPHLGLDIPEERYLARVMLPIR